MSDELNEALDAGDVVLSDEVTDQQSSADGAPGEAPATEEGEKLSGYDKRISVLTARLRDKEQRLAQLEAERATRETLAEQEQPPEIPDLPDDDLRYSDPAAFKKAMRERDKAIGDYAAYNARQSLQQQRKDEATRTEAEAKRARNQEIVASYIDNGLQQGITEDRMLSNEKVLQSAKVSPDLAAYLFSDENGARLVDYLARNPDQLVELSRLPPTVAAVKIATEIKPKALATKPHVTKAPDPAVPTRGGGKPLGDEWKRTDVGGTFE